MCYGRGTSGKGLLYLRLYFIFHGHRTVAILIQISGKGLSLCLALSFFPILQHNPLPIYFSSRHRRVLRPRSRAIFPSHHDSQALRQ